MLRRTKLRLGVAALALCTVATTGVISASADPTAPTFRTLSGVGSDTIQDIDNGLSTVIPALGSYDATGSATIVTKSGGVSYARPNGSGAGLNALSDSAQGGTHLFNGVDITGQVDFARSSSGPSGSGTALTYIPFAKDAVTFAVNAASDFPRDIAVGSASQDATTPAPFTLRNIYRCTVTTYTSGAGDDITIRPLLPQQNSGTRKFWLSTIGLTEAQVAGCATDLSNTVEEHNGTFVTGPGDIVPFSIAQFIAQGNWSTLPSAVLERRGNIDLGQISGVKPYNVTIGSGAVLNTSFPVTRNVYNVVQTSRLAESAIAATFVGSSSAVCSNATLIKKYGFGTLGSACGSTTTTGPFTQ
jgi:ABC-type phosphate transport system substrate-binding protein